MLPANTDAYTLRSLTYSGSTRTTPSKQIIITKRSKSKMLVFKI